MHVWTLNNWEKNLDMESEFHRRGTRLKIDSKVDPEVRRACKEFIHWLRKEYYFPMRVPIYLKNTPTIKAMDGERVYGTFFRPYDYSVEPYIRVAVGDYEEMVERWSKESALTAILKTIAHELTHYFQWINNLELTLIGEERQALRYARFIIDEYALTREDP